MVCCARAWEGAVSKRLTGVDEWHRNFCSFDSRAARAMQVEENSGNKITRTFQECRLHIMLGKFNTELMFAGMLIELSDDAFSFASAKPLQAASTRAELSPGPPFPPRVCTLQINEIFSLLEYIFTKTGKGGFCKGK